MRLNFNRSFENCGEGAKTMLAIEGLARRASERITVRPACPNCGRPMYLARSTARAGLPDLRTYGCGECGVWLTEAADGRDESS
jgi:ribosomal protein S27AE